MEIDDASQPFVIRVSCLYPKSLLPVPEFLTLGATGKRHSWLILVPRGSWN